MDLENKQAFLRKEILDKGFDGNEFFNYLISLKGDEGGDLNNWTFPELQSVVNQFQTNHQNSQNAQNFPSKESVLSTSSAPIPMGYDQPQPNIPNPQSEINTYPPFNPSEHQPQQPINPQNIQILQSTDRGNDNIKSHDIMEIECLPPEESALSKYEGLIVTLSL